MDTEQIKDVLETLVDKSSFSAIVSLLAEIAIDKEEHVNTNWQDANLARLFSKLSTLLIDCSVKIKNGPNL